METFRSSFVMTRVYSTILAGNTRPEISPLAILRSCWNSRGISRVYSQLCVFATCLSLSLSHRLFSSSLGTTHVSFLFLHDLLSFSFIPRGNRYIAPIVPRRFWQRRQCVVLGRRPNVINCKSGHCFPAREFNVTRWGSLRVSFDSAGFTQRPP